MEFSVLIFCGNDPRIRAQIFEKSVFGNKKPQIPKIFNFHEFILLLVIFQAVYNIVDENDFVKPAQLELAFFVWRGIIYA